MKYMGIDYGSQKVGIALSDEMGMMGFPHSILTNTPELLGQLCSLIAKEGVGAVVLGESRTLGGGENAIAAAAKALGDELSKSAGVPVFYESEVFTSAEARRQHDPSEKTRKPKSRVAIDDSAAALILTSYLSRQNG